MVMLFFFTGLILFCIAIIGAYIGRIFEQGQLQPLYWLSDARNLDLDSVNDKDLKLPELVLSERILKQAKDDVT